MFDLPTLPERKTVLGVVAAFFLAGLVVYAGSLNNEFVRWDDGLLITENPAIREISFSSLAWIFTHYDPELYIPLTFFSYQIDFLLGGGGPFMFHFSSLVLHIINALLVAWLAYLIFGRRFIALFLGLFFLLHPLHTEALAWASGRKDVLSGSLFLLSLITYLLSRDRESRRLFILSIIAFGLGLMAKVSIIMLPFALILLDLWQERKIGWRMLLEKIPYFALSFVFGLVAVFGKTHVIEKSSVLDKILMACKSSVFYLEKIFVPTKLAVLYPYVGEITPTSPDFYIPVLLVVAVLVIAALLYRKIPGLLWGLLMFFALVSPSFVNFAKGGVDIYFASDRYAYLPSIGVMFAFAAVIVWWLDRSRARLLSDSFATLAGVALLFFAGFTHAQSKTWENTETLFRNVLTHYPHSHVAHTNIGNVYRRADELDKAIAEFEAALALQPHSRTYANLGAVYRKRKQYEEAYAQYEKALQSNPQSKEAHLGLGLVHAETGKTNDARIAYDKALAIDPLYEEAYVNLGALLMQQGRVDEAIEIYNRAIGINPYLPDARYNLAVAYAAQKKIDEAIEQYEWTVRMAPSYIPARINLGILYSQTGETEKSIEQFRKILEIDPSNGAAKSALKQLGAM